MRVITLGNGKQVAIGAFVAGIKSAIANPDATFKHGLGGWWPVTGAEIRREFLASVHDRINAAEPYSSRGVN